MCRPKRRSGPRGGGYETRLTSYSNLEPAAGRKIADAAIELTSHLAPGTIPQPAPLPPFVGKPWTYGSLPPNWIDADSVRAFTSARQAADGWTNRMAGGIAALCRYAAHGMRRPMLDRMGSMTNVLLVQLKSQLTAGQTTGSPLSS